jgi:hypothetical protein
VNKEAQWEQKQQGSTAGTKNKGQFGQTDNDIGGEICGREYLYVMLYICMLYVGISSIANVR